MAPEFDSWHALPKQERDWVKANLGFDGDERKKQKRLARLVNDGFVFEKNGSESPLKFLNRKDLLVDERKLALARRGWSNVYIVQGLDPSMRINTDQSIVTNKPVHQEAEVTTSCYIDSDGQRAETQSNILGKFLDRLKKYLSARGVRF